MRVLVVGSLHFPGAEEARTAFQQACREIGSALVRAGFELVVGSDGPNTADRYVIEGASEVEGKHRVRVIRPESGDTPFAREAEQFSRLEFVFQRHQGPWAAGRVPQVLAADVVVLIGGGGGTESAGHIAATLQRPVLAVACFGGAAATMWRHLAPYYERLGELGERLNAFREAWHPSDAQLAAEALPPMVRSGVFRTRDRRPLIVLLGFQILLFATWLLLFTHPNMGNASYSFFALLAVASFLGTGLRASLKMVFDAAADLSWDQLLVDASAGLILAFGLSLVYLVGGITLFGDPTTVLLPKELPAFQRAAVVMTILGLAGGLMIEQVAEWLKGWLVDRLAKPT